jgi:hypothetical protein
MNPCRSWIPRAEPRWQEPSGSYGQPDVQVMSTPAEGQQSDRLGRGKRTMHLITPLCDLREIEWTVTIPEGYCLREISRQI